MKPVDNTPSHVLIHPQAVPSAEGKIEEMIMMYPHFSLQNFTSCGTVVQDLLTQMPETTFTFFVYQHPGETDYSSKLYELVAAAGRSSASIRVVTNNSSDFTPWIRDPFFPVRNVLGSKAGPAFAHLMQPESFSRGGLDDDEIAPDLSAAAPDTFTNFKVPILFQGGDILVGDTFFLVGNDCRLQSESIVGPPTKNNRTPIESLFKEHFSEDKQAIDISYNQRIFDVAIPVYNRTNSGISGPNAPTVKYPYNPESSTDQSQPIFHLDLFITLAGRASGKAGAPYVLVVGQPTITADPTLPGYPAIVQHITTITTMINTTINMLEENQNVEFQIERIPLPMVCVQDKANNTVNCFWASYNNCLVEIASATEKQIWLPTYGDDDWATGTLAAATATWTGLGFKVNTLTNYTEYAQQYGAAHCITNEWKRGPFN